MRIPLFDPAPTLARDRPALEEALRQALDAGTFVLGPAVARFEQQLADYLGDRGEVVAVASGSDALELALRALDVGPGQAVVTTPYTFVATAEAIAHAGATPVFADLDPRDGLLDLAAVERALAALPSGASGYPRLPDGAEVTALLPVHLFGAVVDPDALARVAARWRLRVVEDTAQALGARHSSGRAGALATAGCFSFFPSKTLGALGDGGAIWTSSAAVATRLRRLRQHGQPGKGEASVELGRNSRLDALQAAFLSIKLAHLDDDIAARRALLDHYLQKLSARAPWLTPLVPAALAGHAAQQLVVRAPRRDALAAHLRDHGIASAVYYPQPLHHLPPFAACPRLTPLPHAERLATEALALPLYPGMPVAWVDEVVDTLVSFAR